MKQKFIVVVIFIIAFSIYSCEKAKDAIPVGKMEASIDGSSWKALTRLTILESDFFTITGTSANGDVVSIIIMGTTEGTYSLDISVTGAETQVGGFYKPASAMGDSDNYIITKATVVLSDVDSSTKKISGTFELTVTKTEIVGGSSIESLEITNGIFDNLKYTET